MDHRGKANSRIVCIQPTVIKYGRWHTPLCGSGFMTPSHPLILDNLDIFNMHFGTTFMFVE